MQKKIIALAIAGLSSAAFAQTNVTLSGLVDVGYYSQSIQTAGIMDTKTYAAANNSATSQLNITITENIGNGMNVKFFGETDWAPTSNASVLLNSYNYLELSGGWGAIRGGNLNTDALYATIGAQPFGTGIGSGISGGFGRLSRAGVNGAAGAANAATAAATTAVVQAEGEQVGAAAAPTAAVAGVRSVRVNNSIQYSTPTFSGFSGSLQMAKQNDDATVVTGGNTAGFTSIGVKYNNGPINVYYVNEATKAGAVAVGGLGIGEKVTHNILTGNYTFGPATIYAGWTSSKSSGVAVQTADARSWNLGLKYNVTGALSLAAQVLKVDDKLAGSDKDRNLNALGLDYAMSKRTSAYVRWESGDNDRSNATGTSVGNFTRWGAGLRHSF